MKPRPSKHPDTQLEEAASRMRDEAIDLLAETAREFGSSLRLEIVLRNIARRVYRLVDCHLFSVLLHDESRECLELAYALKYGESVPAEGQMRRDPDHRPETPRDSKGLLMHPSDWPGPAIHRLYSGAASDAGEAVP